MEDQPVTYDQFAAWLRRHDLEPNDITSIIITPACAQNPSGVTMLVTAVRRGQGDDDTTAVLLKSLPGTSKET